MSPVDSTPYRDHLQMEIKFMGWLALFCLALAAGAADRMILESKISIPSAILLLIAAGLSQVILAAFFFFRQRAGLARLHERLSLRQAQGDETELAEQLEEATSHAHRVYLHWGFSMLGLGMLNLGLALLEIIFQPATTQTYGMIGFLSFLVFFLVLLYLLLTRSIFNNPSYNHHPTPFKAFYRDLGKDFSEVIDYNKVH